MPALLPPFSGPRSTGVGDAEPSRHHPEGVADADERRFGLGADGVEKPNSGASQEGSSAIPWLPNVDPVVLCGIEVTGAAGADIDASERTGRRRKHAGPPDVARDGAHPQSRRRQRLRQVARDRSNRHHQRIVADVGPPMVHVEDMDVDDVWIGRRRLVGSIGAGIEKRPRFERPAAHLTAVRTVNTAMVAVQGHWREDYSTRATEVNGRNRQLVQPSTTPCPNSTITFLRRCARRRAGCGARAASRSSPSSRSRSASAHAPRSTRWSTACSCSRCPIPSRIDSSTCGR